MYIYNIYIYIMMCIRFVQLYMCMSYTYGGTKATHCTLQRHPFPVDPRACSPSPSPERGGRARLSHRLGQGEEPVEATRDAHPNCSLCGGQSMARGGAGELQHQGWFFARGPYRGFRLEIHRKSHLSGLHWRETKENPPSYLFQGQMPAKPQGFPDEVCFLCTSNAARSASVASRRAEKFEAPSWWPSSTAASRR